MRKQIEFENIEITDWAAEGKAITRVDNMIVFVKDVIPGDIVNLRVKRKKSYAEGYVIKMVKPSPDALTPFCSHFNDCGGCVSQRMSYDEQLKYKEKQVGDQLQRIGGIKTPVIKPILPSAKTIFYRNKLEFTFSQKRWLTSAETGNNGDLDTNALGFHVSGRFDKVLDIDKCWLQDSPSNEIRTAAKAYALAKGYKFFDIKNKTGFLRNLIIRTSSTGEVMVIVVFGSDCEPERKDFMEMLKNTFDLTSLQYTINTKGNDSIQDLDIICYSGKPYIEEKMEGLIFRIGPKSFYQTNSEQACTLYKVVRKYAALGGNEIVYDLYTGTGTIANYLAEYSKKVVGIEYVPEAIEDAKINSVINKIRNTAFYSGDIKDVLTKDFILANGLPDVAIIDPPRAGLHPSIPAALLEAEPAKIIYVSCNPATQARDIFMLSSKYELVESQPVDMFPHTHHVENIALLRNFHIN
ncbi:MAG: 23S rRNA (uracil(1939)-C(5))-methyltransferase RlmD [Prevotellaceae bacterium]|jgi:23S rRNA (uracil1939-C5)-methyltransferase|nr:23S rRNA (uracil(1939)-C(5))-methyltransferase RlmD [Prevotellaceae bacterium]